MMPCVAVVLLYLASASALFLAVRRLLSGGAIQIRSMMILVVLPFVLTGPAIFSGKISWPLDTACMSEPYQSAGRKIGVEQIGNATLFDLAHQIHPWRFAVREAVEAGEWPLWNRTILCGDILAASAQPAPYHPVVLLSLILSPPWDLSFTVTATLFLAALSSFLLLKVTGCSEGPALIGAAGWMLSSLVAFMVGWPLGMAIAAAPWVLAGARAVTGEPGPRSAALLGTGLFLLILAGHPESILHVVAGGCVFALCLLLSGVSPAPARSIRWGVGAGIAAALVTAIHWLPVIDAIPQTADYPERRAVFANQERNATPRVAFERLRPNIVPFVYGIPGEKLAEVPDSYFLPSHAAAGTLLLAPAFIGLFFSRRAGRWPLAWLGLVGTLAGVSAPPLGGLLARLPLFDIALNERLVLFGALATTHLAALGFEVWILGRKRIAPVAIATAVVLVVGCYVVRLWHGMKVTGLDDAFLARHASAALLPAALLAIVFFLARGWGQSGKWVVATAFLLLVASRRIEVGHFYPASDPRLFRPALEIEEVTRPRGSPERIAGQYYTFFANLSTFYGLEDVRGYQPMTHSRFRGSYKPWCFPMFPSFNRVEDLGTPWMRLLGVRWAFAPPDRSPPAGWTLSRNGPKWKLFRAENPLPRAFVPKVIRVGGEPGLILDEMSREADFGRRGWVEAAVAGAGREELENGPGRVFTWWDEGRLELRARMEKRGWVVVVETAWRGWRAYLDGKEVPVRIADYSFLGVEVPEGRHEIRLAFDPLSFRIGRAVSFAALGLLILFAVIYCGAPAAPVIAQSTESAATSREN